MGISMRNYSKMSIKCSLCSGSCQEILDLGEQNLANNLSNNQSEIYSTFKLSLVICKNCGIQQLDGIVDPTIMFQNYLWVTGTSETTLSYLERLALFCNNYKGVNARVLEIASNDGSFLECMVEHGWSVKGVDPARNIADLANSNQTNYCLVATCSIIVSSGSYMVHLQTKGAKVSCRLVQGRILLQNC